jgi:molybdate transport system ATP-binding protein
MSDRDAMGDPDATDNPDPGTGAGGNAAGVVRIAATTTVGGFTVSADFGADAGITALFGPSGAGKSVTLATIAGLLRPTVGTVELDGVLVADAGAGVHVPTQRRGIGMVFQQPALLAYRSPLDNVALAVSGADRRSRRAVAREWLERVDAGHLADAPTTTMSGGEQQRVSLARALAGSPRVLLLDEPFSALDLAARVALRSLVRQLVDAHGIAAVLVTHDLDDIVNLADRVVLFEPGATTGSYDLPVDAPGGIAGLLGLTD